MKDWKNKLLGFIALASYVLSFCVAVGIIFDTGDYTKAGIGFAVTFGIGLIVTFIGSWSDRGR